MALRGTLTHWKTRLLAEKLGISLAHALGLLEALWHVTAEDAPSGNIGRLPNKAIVMQMFTDFDPDRLIDALTVSGHLDKHPAHRLVVHDWNQHADYNTKRKVNRRGELMHTVNGDVKPLDNDDTSSPVMTCHNPTPEPVPEPEPEKPSASSGEKTESSGNRRVSSPKAKPSGPVDPRTGEFKKLFWEYYRQQVGEDPDWDAQEGAALKKFLKANPKIKPDQWNRILDHRRTSPGLAHADRLSVWIKHAKNWLNGPANKWGDPVTGKKPSQKISELDHGASLGFAPGESVGKL